MNALLPLVTNYGVWGVVAALLATNTWLMKQLLQVIKSCNKIIADNTKAIADSAKAVMLLDEHMREIRDTQAQIRDNLLIRPCQLQHQPQCQQHPPSS